MGKVEQFLERAEAIEQGLLDIGRASKSSGVSVKMIRHYEAIGLLKKVARTYANYRVYKSRSWLDSPMMVDMKLGASFAWEVR